MALAWRLNGIMAGTLLALASASPAAAGTILDAPARAPTAAEMMTGKPAKTIDSPFDAAIVGYHATTAWIGIPERDIESFIAAFLKGTALLALVYAFSQRRLFLGGMTRRS